MLITQSNIKIVDNTGVKIVYAVIDAGKTAKIGDSITCVIKRARSNITKYSKGSLVKVLIISSRFGYK